MATFYTDLAYGNKLRKKGKKKHGKRWEIRYSFRCPAFDGVPGEEFGPWHEADAETAQRIERMIQTGKIVEAA